MVTTTRSNLEDNREFRPEFASPVALKIPWGLRPVWVRFPAPEPHSCTRNVPSVLAERIDQPTCIPLLHGARAAWAASSGTSGALSQNVIAFTPLGLAVLPLSKCPFKPPPFQKRNEADNPTLRFETSGDSAARAALVRAGAT
jgi:hypothetical protein